MAFHDPVTGAALLTHALGDGAIARVVCSPDGKQLAVAVTLKGAEPGQTTYDVKLLDAATGKEQAVLGAASASVPDLSFSPDGHLLAAAWPSDRTILWDLPGRRSAMCLREIPPGWRTSPSARTDGAWHA